MNRSFTAKLSHRTPARFRDYLWATHRIFNESLAYLLKHYFWMQNLTDREAEQDQKNRLRARFNAKQLEWFKLIYRDMLGLDLPKDKRAGRSQSVQAWMEPITFSRGSTGEGPGESSKNINAEVKKVIRELRKENLWLFDRELAFPISPDNGFRRGLFGSAARRILNFEQNSDTHRGHFEEEKKKFERWKGATHDQDSVDEDVVTRPAGWKRWVLRREWGRHQTAEREAELNEIDCLSWTDFERAKNEFAAYERERTKKRAEKHGLEFDPNKLERINGAMARGWRDIYEKLTPPDATDYPDAEQATNIIKAYQTAEPRKIGDINFFLWLAGKPHLWRYVETIRRFNDSQRKLEQYDQPIQFRYPRHSRRPDWFTFSETSPGHMYTIVSMNPMIIQFSVFVPVEDVAILELDSGHWLNPRDAQVVADRASLSDDERNALKYAKTLQYKLDKSKSLSDLDSARWRLANEIREKLTRRLLDKPIDWGAYRLTPEWLARRHEDYVADLNKTDSQLVAKANLQAVHDWTNSVWIHLLGGFFKDDPPLDLSRFQRVMIRYELSTDKRLRPFVESPTDEKELEHRLLVDTEERQKPHWQGAYKFWFGPLADRNGSLINRRRFLRSLPLVVGGVRLEYRGRIRDDVDPIFTLSCELDERIEDQNGKRTYPAPAHRIPKKEPNENEPSEGQDAGKAKKRTSGRMRKMPSGLKILAIDLGQRHIATGAVVQFVEDGNGKGILPSPLKPLAVEFMNVPGVTLTHIQRHQDERRRKQQKSCPRGGRIAFEIRGTHLPRGQLFARRLLDHVENLKDDRRKKSAHAVLRAALKHDVDYIVFENLKGYRPDVEFGRRTNAALMTWNRRELVEFVKMEAAPFGIHVYEWVPPHHTSKFCHRCGAVGYRFTHITPTLAEKDELAPAEPVMDADGNPVLDAKGKQVFRRKWSPRARRSRGTPLGLIAGRRQAIDGGKHFCCMECGLMVNADYNAAMNLARKLANDFPAYQKYAYRPDTKAWVVDGETFVGKALWSRARALVQQRLNERFKQPPDTPPAYGWPNGLPTKQETTHVPW